MKKSKLISLLAAAAIVISALPVSSAALTEATYSITEYQYDSTPRALVVSYYSGIYSRGFAWYTDEATEETKLYVAEGIVGEDYDFEANAVDCKANCTSSVVFDDEVENSNVRSHQAYIENLKKGTYYTYKLGGAGNYLYGVFLTESNEDDITILNFNDSQVRVPSELNIWENTVKTAFGMIDRSELDFVLHGGDLYANNMRENISHFNRWGANADTLRKYSGDIPIEFVCGNHEASKPTVYPSSNAVKFGGVADDKSTAYYSFDYGPVHFVMLGYFRSVTSDGFKAEMEWLKSDLKSASENENTKWTIVSTHWGPYSTGDTSDSLKIAGKLAPIMSEYHVDLVIQADAHTYNKTLPYKWDAKGYSTTPRGLDKIVALEPATVDVSGITYQAGENGTYYITCGTAGPGYGGAEYATPGEGSYVDAPVKIMNGTITVDSPYAKIGDEATAGLSETMFGVLNISGDTLRYDFYVATAEGESVLFDTMRIFKGDESERTAAEELNRKVITHKDDPAALSADYAEYSAISGGAAALLSDEAVSILASFAKANEVPLYKAEASSAKVSLVSADKSANEDGKTNIRLVAEMDADSTSCGFRIKYSINGTVGELSYECTEAYSASVSSNESCGFKSTVGGSGGKLLFAVTVEGIPDDGVIMSVTPYVTANDGKTINGEAGFVTVSEGQVTLTGITAAGK